MSDADRVTVTMPGFVADFIADALEYKAFTDRASGRKTDDAYADLAHMLRYGGRDAEVTVRREEA